MVILTGNVIANAMGKNNPGFAFGTVIFIAAGTAIYEALAAKIAKINRLEVSVVINPLNHAKALPFTKGITKANAIGNQPFEKNDFNFLPLVIPISNKKIAKNPLNKSFVKGAIPCASLALVR